MLHRARYHHPFPVGFKGNSSSEQNARHPDETYAHYGALIRSQNPKCNGLISREDCLMILKV